MRLEVNFSESHILTTLKYNRSPLMDPALMKKTNNFTGDIVSQKGWHDEDL